MLTAFSEDPGSVPSIDMVTYNLLWSYASLWLLRAPPNKGTHNSHRHAHIHTKLVCIGLDKTMGLISHSTVNKPLSSVSS